MTGAIRLLLAGDVMTGRGLDQVLGHPGPPQLHEHGVGDARVYVRLAESVNGPIPRGVPPSYPWGDALAQMDGRPDALRIVNLETAITAGGAPWPGKGIHYRMHPANVDVLRAARLDACILANNHVLDWGAPGLDDTLGALDGAGLAHAGAGRDLAAAMQPLALTAPESGRLLVLAGAEPGSGVPADWAARRDQPGIALLPDLSLASAHRIADAAAAARRPRDRVLVSLHWGGNWGFGLPSAHRDFAHALIDSGAVDVVHGHSSHHPLPVEVHRGRAILYGCGDFLNDYEGIDAHGTLRSDVACLYDLLLAPDGALQSLEVLPFRLQRFRLGQADEAARRWVRRIFEEEGRAFGTRVTETDAGTFRLAFA